MSILIKKCKHCEKIFDIDSSQRIYCSHKCYRKQRKIWHKKYTRDIMRKERGTLERWADELRNANYLVFSPGEMRP